MLPCCFYLWEMKLPFPDLIFNLEIPIRILNPTLSGYFRWQNWRKAPLPPGIFPRCRRDYTSWGVDVGKGSCRVVYRPYLSGKIAATFLEVVIWLLIACEMEVWWWGKGGSWSAINWLMLWLVIESFCQFTNISTSQFGWKEWTIYLFRNTRNRSGSPGSMYKCFLTCQYIIKGNDT